MTHKTLSFLLSFFLLSTVTMGQSVLLQEQVSSGPDSSNFGPNKRHYVHTFFSYGFLFGDAEDGAVIKVPHSRYFNVGLRYKLKVCDHYALGLSIAYDRYAYRIKQTAGKLVPNTVHHEKERIILNNLTGTFYNRFNFGKRGNSLGTYLDVGVFGGYAIGRKHAYVDDLAGGKAARERKVKEKGVKYLEPLQYGGVVRFGHRRFSLFGKYRVSNLFKDSGLGQGVPELPRFLVGLQLALNGQ